MKIKNFINEYNKSSDKQRFFKNHIVNQYVSYETKVSKCQHIVDLCMYKKIGEKKVFLQNTPGRFLVFTCLLITEYTDIEIPDDKWLDAYNELDKACLIEPILAAIPEKENKEYSTIMQMVVGDEMENYRSFAGFLGTKFQSIEMFFSSLKDVLSDEEQLKAIVSQVVEKYKTEESS